MIAESPERRKLPRRQRSEPHHSSHPDALEHARERLTAELESDPAAHRSRLYVFSTRQSRCFVLPPEAASSEQALTEHLFGLVATVSSLRPRALALVFVEAGGQARHLPPARGSYELVLELFDHEHYDRLLAPAQRRDAWPARLGAWQTLVDYEADDQPCHFGPLAVALGLISEQEARRLIAAERSGGRAG